MFIKINIITFSLYFFITVIVINLMNDPTQSILLWPAVGIGMITALVWGYKVLPGLYLAQFAISYLLYADTSHYSLLDFAISNAFISAGLFRCYFGAFLIRYIVGYPNSLVSFQSILKLFLIVAPIATFISTLYYDLVKNLLGLIDNIAYSRNILDWWFGDLLGFIIFAPIAMIFICQPKSIWKPRLQTVGIPIVIIFLSVILIYNKTQKDSNEGLMNALHLKNQVLTAKLNSHNLWLDRLLSNIFSHFLPKGDANTQLEKFFNSLKKDDPGDNAIVWIKDDDVSYYNSSNNTELFSKIKRLDIRQLIANIHADPYPISQTRYLNEINQFINVFRIKNSNGHVKIAVFHDFNDELTDLLNELDLTHSEISLSLNNNSESITLRELDEQLPINDFTLESNLKFYNENWILRISPTSRYIYLNQSNFSSIIAKIGFLFTGLIGIMLLIITGKSTLTDIQVKERTLNIDRKSNELRKSKKQYQDLIEQHPVILWRQDIQQNTMSYISDKVERQYGYSLNDWLNEVNFWINHIHNDDKERVRKTIEQALKDNRGFELEYRFIKSDYSVAWIKDVININKVKGHNTELIGLMIDVSEAQEAKAGQYISESNYQILFKHAVDPLIIINLDDHSFSESNDKAIELFGLNKISGHVTLTEFSTLKQPDGGSSKKKLMKIYSKLQQNKFINFEWSMYNKDHKQIICTIDLVKLPRQNNNIALANINDITVNKLHEKKINQLAYYDNLTKLPNREYFYSKFNYFHKLAVEKGEYGTIIYLDLDRFKILNDSLGHQAGDELLKMVAERIRKVTKKIDFCARLGGDEFVVLTKRFESSKESTLESSLVKSELILEALNEPYQLGDYEHLITPSIGISLFPSGNTTTDQIIHQADIAMYASKEKGKNTITIYQDKMIKLVGERLIIEKAIRQAFDQNEFQLHYQPQINLNNDIFSVEALLRWSRSHEFNINTEDLIETIEQIGLTHELGYWVFDRACSQLESWQQQGHTVKSVAINVSAKQFHQNLFVDQIRSVIQSYNLKPSQIIIELTEAVIIEDMPSLIQKLTELKNYGIRSSLDDFGTGYSSLAYLKNLPIDQLKIDKLFIHDLSRDESSQHIVKTIITLAESMHIELIAEGIEMIEQYEILKSLGCQNFQGYYFSKPLPGDLVF